MREVSELWTRRKFLVGAGAAFLVPLARGRVRTAPEKEEENLSGLPFSAGDLEKFIQGEAGKGGSYLPLCLHRTRFGDTLAEIASRLGTPQKPWFDALERAEGHRNPLFLPVGKTLIAATAPQKAPWQHLYLPHGEARGEYIQGAHLGLCIENGSDGSRTTTANWYDSQGLIFSGHEVWMNIGYDNVISVHRDTLSGEQVAGLKEGEAVTVSRKKDYGPQTSVQATYKVGSSLVLDAVDPHDGREVILEHMQKYGTLSPEALYLITCHPAHTGLNAPQRLVVFAERI